MKKEEENKIKTLKQFFDISVAAFEMQHSVSKAFGYSGHKSYMHTLHINAKEEINKEEPSLEKMDIFLSMMEREASKGNIKPSPNPS
jgi:hypothetical protein